jgi:hypothetical protein
MGLQGMIGDMVDALRRRTSSHARRRAVASAAGPTPTPPGARWRRLITALEDGTRRPRAASAALREAAGAPHDARAGHHRHRRRGQDPASPTS